MLIQIIVGRNIWLFDSLWCKKNLRVSLVLQELLKDLRRSLNISSRFLFTVCELRVSSMTENKDVNCC